MTPTTRRKFGRANLDVTAMGFGAAPIGNFKRPISEDTGKAMIDRAWDAGLRYFDTAPLYGHGLSELRLGHYLRWRPRNEFVLSTKVGRLLDPAPRGSIAFEPWVDAAAFKLRLDYSYDAAMRSFEDSLQRLGLERIDLAFIHDCDVFNHGVEQQKVYFKQAVSGAFKALEKLRDQKLVKSIGWGLNEWQVCQEALQQTDSDSFLLAGRYTLLEQEALDAFLPLCVKRNVAIVIGGGLNGGILAKGARPGATWNYAPAPEWVLKKVGKIEAVCNAHKVPMAAAALQFVMAHPAIATHCPGTRTVAQLEQNLAWSTHPIPAALWAELKQQKLLREDAPVPT